MLANLDMCKPHHKFGLWQTQGYTLQEHVASGEEDFVGTYCLHSFDPLNPDAPYHQAINYVGRAGAWMMVLDQTRTRSGRKRKWIVDWEPARATDGRMLGVLHRFETHSQHQGSFMTRAFLANGRILVLARAWRFPKPPVNIPKQQWYVCRQHAEFEAYLKQVVKNSRNFCPCCNSAVRHLMFDPAFAWPVQDESWRFAPVTSTGVQAANRFLAACADAVEVNRVYREVASLLPGRVAT